MTEYPVLIQCEDALLNGIVNKPVKPKNIGVVIVVAGGPQYRVGAHRQFVTLARMLSDRGIASLRFDHRGTGDSGGKFRGFIDMNTDIKSAVNNLCNEVSNIDKVVLWGECESASASAFYAYTDPRIKGLFMVNPWIRTIEGEAKTFLKHYYWNRLFEKEFWLKIKSGRFSIMTALTSFIQLIKSSFNQTKEIEAVTSDKYASLPLPARLEVCSDLFNGDIFILTSGKDYIAQEFKDYLTASGIWGRMEKTKKLTLCEIKDSDHTFSRKEWRDQLFSYTGTWLTGISK